MNGLNSFESYHSSALNINDLTRFNEIESFEGDFNNYSQVNRPTINIFLYNYSQSPSVYPSYAYGQQSFQPNSSYNFSPYQMPQFQQQPSFLYCNQPIIPFAQSVEENKSSKKDKKHKDKKHKKSTKSKDKKSSKKEKSQSIPYIEGNHLKGIINYLTSKTGGNVCDNGTISIQGSSNQSTFDSSIKDARNLCNFNDLSRMSMWSPDGERNANILFDFKDRRIRITDYSLHTPTDPTSDYPKSWKVECSNDMSNWVTCDLRNDERSMNDYNACNTFKCINQQSDFYRYVKITSTGPCWNSSTRYYFDVSAVEFFGFLKE